MSEMETEFRLAGCEIDWPLGSAPGLTNHPDIEIVANRLENIASSGVGFALAGSWTLGEQRGGNAYVRTENGWEYRGGDEFVNVGTAAGYNAKALPGPGTDVGMQRLDDLLDITWSKDVELALSLSPHSGNPLEELKEIISIARGALDKGVLYTEINLSCPNVPNRPPFYKDIEGVMQFNDYVNGVEPLVNRFGYPGVYVKYGPFESGEFNAGVHMADVESVGGRVTSNTLANQVPHMPDGSEAIKFNNGKAGMSGPALKHLGRAQLSLLAQDRKDSTKQSLTQELISVLGVDSGQEVKKRLDLGAKAIQLGSVLYWPELIGCETPAEAVAKIKDEFVEVVGSA